MTSSAAFSEPPYDLVIAGAKLVATCDNEGRELPDGYVAVRQGRVAALGVGPAPRGLECIDGTGCLVTPGLINVHHHFWQNLTRAYRPMVDCDFLGWLAALYPLWAKVDAEAIFASTQIALAELALSGCTTTSDHLYLQPPEQPSLVEVEINAAQELGLRLHVTRGSVDRGRKHGSPMPDHMLERVDDVLRDCERLVAKYHQRGQDATLQVALGPHSVFAASPELMRETAKLAQALDVRLHTHLSGDSADESYCLDLYGMRPVEWFESLGWASPRTWVAHCFFPNPAEIARLGACGVGVAHCATAGLLMGVGVAPVKELARAGSPVGLGVDGSSNSDASSLWLEARMAMIANRSRLGPAAFGARDALLLATRGGARCLGRDGEIGVLAVGANADICIWPQTDVAWAGAISDPISAWLRCGPAAPRDVLVGGKRVVQESRLLKPVDDLLRRHEICARRLQAC